MSRTRSLAAVLVLALPAAAQAATFTVNQNANDATADAHCTDADTNTACSLREASSASNASIGVRDTIMFDSGTNLPTVGNDDIDISDPVDIIGNGALNTQISGTGGDRVFDYFAALGSAGNPMTLSGVRISGGFVVGGEDGGGIRLLGNSHLALTNVSVEDNDSIGAGAEGGGIHAADLSTLTLTRSNLFSNSSELGGGIYSEGDVTLRDSSILSNSTADPGLGSGGVHIAGDGSLTMRGATVSRNDGGRAGATPLVSNIGHFGSGPASSINSIVSEPGTYPSGVSPNCAFGMGFVGWTPARNNIDSSNDECQFGAAGNLLSTDPMFVNNGSRSTNGTFGRALTAGSPALDAGDNAACTSALDQFSATRKQDAGFNGPAICDIGAIEFPGGPGVAPPATGGGSAGGDTGGGTTTPPAGGGGGGGGTTIPVRDTSAPTGTLSGGATQDPLKLKGVTVDVLSSEPGSASATGSFSAPGASATFTLKPAKANLVAGRKTTMKLGLTTKAKKALTRALKGKRSVTATVTVKIADAVGNTTTKKRKLKLKRG